VIYHNEAYFLYIRLATYADLVARIIIGYSNRSFNVNGPSAPISFAPFEKEIFEYSGHFVVSYCDYAQMPEAGNDPTWGRENSARTHLLEGMKPFCLRPDDLILLTDVDELVTRDGILAMRAHPPEEAYIIPGIWYYYSFMWTVGVWEGSMVVRYGAMKHSLSVYRAVRSEVRMPGIFHHHCSYCFPTAAEITLKWRSFSHRNHESGPWQDPERVYAHIACGRSVTEASFVRRSAGVPKGIVIPNHPSLAYLSKIMPLRRTDDISDGWKTKAPHGCDVDHALAREN
jgi:hypothetical protein